MTIDLLDAADTRAWELLADERAASPFLYPGWILAWWRAFGRGRLALLRSGSSSGEPHAFLPMQTRGRSLISPTDWNTPRFGSVVRDYDGAADLADQLLAAPGTRLSFVPPADPVVTELVASVSARERAISQRTKMRSPTIQTTGDWHVFQTGLRAKFRSELRRRRARLEERGTIELDIATTPRLLAEGLRVEASGWKNAQGTAILASTTTESFYREIATWAAERGWLRLAMLRSGGDPVAFDFALEAHGSHLLVKTGFDPSWAAFGPGMLLREMMVQRAFEDPDVHRYEFLGGDQTWKREWTKQSDELVEIQVFAPGALGHLGRAAATRARPLAKRAAAGLRSS